MKAPTPSAAPPSVPPPSDLLAAIVESSDDAILSMDPDGIITSWNAGAERLYGYSAADVIGRSISLVVPAARQAEEREILDQIRRGIRLEHYETVRQRKDGSPVDVSLTVSPLVDLAGRVIGASKIARNITERKSTESARRLSEERFRLLTDNVPAGIFLSNEKGHCDFVNACWCELAGLSAEEARGEGWARAVHPEDRERVLAGWHAAVDSGEASTAEFRFLRPDGSVVWVHGNAVQFRNGTRFEGYLGSCVDVTQRKLAERQAAFLQELSDRLGAATTPEEILAIATAALGAHLGADACLFFEAADNPAGGTVPHAWSRSDGPAIGGEYPFAGIGMMLTRPRSQVADVREHEATKHAAEGLAAAGIRSFAAATTWQDGHWRLSLAATSREPRQWQPPEMELIEQVLGRAWALLEKSRALAALRESEQLYRAIGESIDYGVWVCDADGRNLYASDSFLQLVGLTQAQCSEFGWGEVLHPDDAEGTLAAWRECSRTGTTWEREHRFRGVDGRWHPVLARGVPIRDASGRILRWVGINLDISRIKQAEAAQAAIAIDNAKLYAALQKELEEQRRAEELLRESERRWRQLAEAMPHLVWTCRPDGLCDFLSPQWVAYTGVAEAEQLGEGWLEQVHPDDQPVIRVAWEQAVHDSKMLDTEFRIRGADGVYRWFKTRAVPVHDDAGRITRWYGSNTDVEELRRAERAVRKSEQQLRLVADHAPIFLAQIDAGHRFKFVNRPYAERYGCTREDIIGRHVSEVAGAAAYEVFRPHLDRALQGMRVEFEQEIPYESLGRTWVHVIYQPERDPGGRVIGLIAVIMDVSARKRAEQELERARDEALAGSRAKDDFLATLSHELRTPLSPVLLLASDAVGNPSLPREIRENFELIRSNITLEARLIDDLLDLTRITRGKMTFERQDVDVHEIIRDALANIGGELESKRLGLAVSLKAAHTHVHGDPVRLQQVFWNLLKNAVKFTDTEGRIQVTTRNPDGQIEVQIADTGIGLTADELPRVFEPFAQGDHAKGGPRQFGGLGLGLAISRRLIELHAGRITAGSSGRNCGAVFTVELPLAILEPGRPAPHPAGHTGPRGKVAGAVAARILLVEDHTATRETLERLLARRNFDVTAVGTAAEARLQMLGQAFDVLVSDVGLPDGDGYELMAEFRRACPGLRGIAVSGYGMEDDLHRSQAAGFAVHLVKPVSISALEEAITRLLAAPSA